MAALARACAVVVCVCWASAAAAAGEPDQVLVVVNGAEPASSELGAYYAERRGVPRDQVLALQIDTGEQVDRPTFERRIEGPIAGWLRTHNAQDRITYIVLVKGIPLKIAGTTGRQGTVASVDSELALLYRRMLGRPVAPQGPVKNPFFSGTVGGAPPARTAAFARSEMDVYLVTRLDGFTYDDARALVDRSVASDAAEPDAAVFLDERGTRDIGDNWLAAAAARLSAAHGAQTVVVEASAAALASERPAIGYFSWGSSDAVLRTRTVDATFVPGAIASRFLSTDARSMVAPPASWVPGGWDERAKFFAESPEALVADLVRQGATGASGNVSEPYLDSAVRPDVLLPAYLAGLNLAEAYYSALPSLSWQTVVLGDPLCRPYRRRATLAPTPEIGVDAVTELPQVFSDRRLEVVWQPDTSKEALKLLLRAESRLGRGDEEGARTAATELLQREPGATAAQHLLASLAERRRDFDEAEVLYRRVLERRPSDPIALNNLAYSLGVRRNRPKEALPLAQLAYKVTGGDPLVADTLGWVLFLLNDLPAARSYLLEAVKLAPNNPELRLHTAVVLAGLGELSDAQAHLTAALALDPGLASREEVRALRERLAAGVARPRP